MDKPLEVDALDDEMEDEGQGDFLVRVGKDNEGNRCVVIVNQQDDEDMDVFHHHLAPEAAVRLAHQLMEAALFLAIERRRKEIARG